jgi:arsenate reductase-like glutaredoxin family protein
MIKLYSMECCSRCMALQKQLIGNNIEFEVVNNRDEIEKEMEKASVSAIPFAKIGKVYVVGATLKKIKELIN